MLPLPSLGEEISTRRKALGLSQTALGRKARLSRATIDALENGRLGELGYNKLANVLNVLGLDLKLEGAQAHRPTLEDLMEENRIEDAGEQVRQSTVRS